MTWAKGTEKRTPVGTAGKEKDRFTSQLSILKSKNNNKLRPVIIWKAALPPEDEREPRRNTVAYEVKHCTPK